MPRKMIKVMVVFGTRPEAIKMAPVVKALAAHPDRVRPVVVVSGQHREMLDQVMEIFDLQSDYDLNVMTEDQSLAEVTTAVLGGLGAVLDEEAPDLLLVQGDTTTTFAAALAAFYHRVPVGHVEAGLRTYNRYSPFPEEINRTLTTRLSTLHFAPTEKSKEHLLSEGISEDAVVVTGNTVIDALLSIVNTDREASQESQSPLKKILVTAHRRESFGQPLRDVCLALLEIVNSHPDVRVVFPVHLNPTVRSTVYELLKEHSQIELLEPLGYRDFAAQMAAAHLILTDSGGIQEEAPALGKPVLVLRNETERQEGIDAGTCRLVGLDPRSIINAVNLLLSDDAAYEQMARAVNPYGDGNAAGRIVECILQRWPE